MELGPSTIVGVALAATGLVLYILKTHNTTTSRDYDLFFSSVGLLCGGILIFQGWRLDPILLLCQLLSSGTAIFFVAQSLWLRNIKTESVNNTLSNQSYHRHTLQEGTNHQLSLLSVQTPAQLAQMRLLFDSHAIDCAISYDYEDPIDSSLKLECCCILYMIQ